MKKSSEPITLERIRHVHAERKPEIRSRLQEFRSIWERGTDVQLFEEMVFCFFTGGCSARMGINSLKAVQSILMTADRETLANTLAGHHRYPNARSGYIVHSREFLMQAHRLRLREKLSGFKDAYERRDWLVREKGIKGLGYKEASHYLRNIGFSGYAILDKHVLNCLAELKFIDEPKPPNTRQKYLSVEQRFGELAQELEIDFDELDLVLWSMKTGVILK